MKDFFIKLLGGYTKKEYINLESKINTITLKLNERNLTDMKEIEQLNILFFAFTDGLENYSLLGNPIFTLKTQEFIRTLRMYSLYNRDFRYEPIDASTFKELEDYLYKYLYIIFCEHRFSDEMYEEAKNITDRINSLFNQFPRNEQIKNMLSIKELQKHD